MKKIVWWIVIILLIVVLGVLAYLGVFTGVKVSETKIGPLTIVYEPYVGDYKNTGKIFNKVYQDLLKAGVKATRSLGIYYDDPKVVLKEKLRSDCGVVLEKEALAKIAELQKKFKIKKIAEQASVVVEFPMKNALSFMIGPSKAYPALGKFLTEKGYQMTSVMELYDMQAKKILYIMGFKKPAAK